MDLIDRQAAIDEAYAVIVDDAVYDVVQVETLEALPSIDAVEVVRCKDCKWFNDIGCSICIVDDSDKPTENDYCSFGERNDG